MEEKNEESGDGDPKMDIADSRHDGKTRQAADEDLEEGIEPDEVILEETVEEEAEAEEEEVEIGVGKTDDPVRLYLKEIGMVPLLSKEGEVSIAKRIEEGKREAAQILYSLPFSLQNVRDMGDKLRKGKIADCGIPAEDLAKALRAYERAEERAKYAKSELVEANLRLVVSIAKKYTNRGLQFLDLIQEGNIGLMKAVDKFEWQRGYKFSTYATWWIRQAIFRALADQARTIRIPVHMIETMNKLILTSRGLVQDLGREPTTEEIAASMKLPVEKVRKIMKIAKEPLSLETPIGEEEDSHLGDFIEDKKVASPLESAIRKNLHQQVRKALNTLTERERRILILRFWTDLYLKKISIRIGISKDRVLQIEKKALRKLRWMRSEDLGMDPGEGGEINDRPIEAGFRVQVSGQ